VSPATPSPRAVDFDLAAFLQQTLDAASRQLAAAWGADAVDLGCCGHVNADSALGDWAQGRALLAALLQRVRHNPTPDSV